MIWEHRLLGSASRLLGLNDWDTSLFFSHNKETLGANKIVRNFGKSLF